MLRQFGFAVVIAGALCAAAAPAQAAFVVVVQNESTSSAEWVVGGTVDNIAEAESLLVNGGPPEFTDAPDVIHYGPTISGFTDFPGGTNNHIAMRADGYVDVVGGGSLSGVTLTVTSDDGFRLLLNGLVVAEHATLRNTDSTSTAPLTLNDGDLISLLYFNGPGEGNVSLNLGSSGGPLIGHAASGMQIMAVVPEPAVAGLVALLAAPAVLRRRR